MSDDNLKRNPYPEFDIVTGKTVWRWRDELGRPHYKLYSDQMAALHDLLKYIKYLNEGATIWQQLWWPIRHGLWPHLQRLWRA